MTKGRKLSVKELQDKLEVDKEERKRVFRSLLDHISSGLSLESFPEISDNAMSRMLKNYPSEFCQETLNAARKKGQTFWETLGRRQASGDCLGNSRSWYYNMSNRYGWTDKQQLNASIDGQLSVNVVNYSSKTSPHSTVDSDVT